MKISEVFSAQIHDLSSAGLGVCSHPSGRTVFVAGAWPGETGEFKIHSLKGWVGFANIVQLTSPSPHRVAPACSAHGYARDKCGGCGWMFIDYAEQLAAKQTRLEKSIQRALSQATTASARQCNVEAIWPATQTIGYRNRAQFKTDGEKIGYLATQSHSLVDIERCPILSATNQHTLAQLRAKLPNTSWRPKAKPKRSRHAGARKAQNISYTNIDIDESVNANTASVNQRLPFAQANSEQNLLMQNWLGQRVQSITAQRGEPVKALELFCGSGNFTTALASAGLSRIIAVECVPQALERLQQKKLPNVETVLCDLYREEKFSALIRQHRDADIVLLDPPREGLKVNEGLFEQCNNFEHVLYISCELATFSRDLALFSAAGYSVTQIQPVDQFPQTPHIEILCHLEKQPA